MPEQITAFAGSNVIKDINVIIMVQKAPRSAEIVSKVSLRNVAILLRAHQGELSERQGLLCVVLDAHDRDLPGLSPIVLRTYIY